MEFEFDMECLLKDISKRTNKDLLLLLLGLIISVFMTIKQGMSFMTIYFYFLSLLSIPLILNGIKDKNNLINKTNLKTTEGEIIDLFPKDDSNEEKGWIIFVKKDDSKKFDTFELPNKPNNLEIKDTISLCYTENLKIPVSIRKK